MEGLAYISIGKRRLKFPLKRHVLCYADHTPFTAYTNKQKHIDYYKCNCNGCRTNVSAKKLHCKYEELLSRYDIPQPLVNVLRDTISKLMRENQTEEMKNINILKKQKSEKENRIKNLQVAFRYGGY